MNSFLPSVDAIDVVWYWGGWALTLFALFVLAKASLRFVPQGYHYNVEQFGKFTRVLSPGLGFIIPIIERTRPVNMMETVIDISPQNVITLDNVNVSADGVVFYEVHDSVAASYKVNDLHSALVALTRTQLRNVIGTLNLDETLSGRETINARLLGVVDLASAPWGVKVKRVEMRDINPPDEIQASMNKQMKAERDKRAEVLNAEGDRQAAIARSEGARDAAINVAKGEREAAFLRAEAREREAQAEAKAIGDVDKAIAEADGQATAYFLGLKEIEARAILAQNAGKGTIIFAPSSTLDTVGAVGMVAKTFSELGNKAA